MTWQKSFCVAGTALLKTPIVNLRGRRSPLHVVSSCSVFFCESHLPALREVVTTGSSVGCDEKWWTPHTKHRFWGRFVRKTVGKLEEALQEMLVSIKAPIPHFILYALHFTLYTLHSALYTPHFTLHTSHSTLHTLHFALCYTPHFAIFTINTLHSTLQTLHSNFTIPHFALYTHTLHSTLDTPHCTLYTPHPNFTAPSWSTFHSLQCTGTVTGAKCTRLLKQPDPLKSVLRDCIRVRGLHLF